jgi:hypothetical protein
MNKQSAAVSLRKAADEVARLAHREASAPPRSGCRTRDTSHGGGLGAMEGGHVPGLHRPGRAVDGCGGPVSWEDAIDSGRLDWIWDGVLSQQGYTDHDLATLARVLSRPCLHCKALPGDWCRNSRGEALDHLDCQHLARRNL